MHKIGNFDFKTLFSLHCGLLCTAIALLLATEAMSMPAKPATSSAAQSSASQERAVTLTYLKSKPGKLRELERFVRANWFVMDALAVKRGLFVSYEWLDSGSDDSEWNAVVIVTYRDTKGFAGIEREWAAIKATHREVLPDGLGMKDLGQVLETKSLVEHAPFVRKRP